MRILKFLFGWRGRIGRKALGLGLSINFLFGLFIFQVTRNVVDGDAKSKIIMFGAITIIFSVLSLTNKRTHDFGEKNEAKVQLISIPIIDQLQSIKEFIRLFSKNGDPESNKYGNPPAF